MKKKISLRLLLLAISILGISLSHYLTPLHLPQLHDVFQRLYYIPIILAAFWFGLRGGLSASIAVSIMYVPHVVFQWGARPSLELEKFLEILLYNVVGGITGFLCQQEDVRRAQLQQTAAGLEESYNKLHKQAELIIRIEEQLRQAERLSALGQLSAVLAHEIRNPLGSIRGTAEILRDDYKPGDKKYEFLEILLKETERLNNVVEDFLGLARPVQTEKDICHLYNEVQEVISLLDADATAHGVTITLLPFDIPMVRGDREKLRQVLFNLLLNGIQATPFGGSITVSGETLPPFEDGPEKVVLNFRDTGNGMTEGVRSKIFEPFFSTKSDGTGLGLAITQKIVESHGGTIDVQTEPGKGSVFKVILPVAD